MTDTLRVQVFFNARTAKAGDAGLRPSPSSRIRTPLARVTPCASLLRDAEWRHLARPARDRRWRCPAASTNVRELHIDVGDVHTAASSI